MNHELTIPEAVIGAAATILRQYAPEITMDFLKSAILEYYHSADSNDKKAMVQRKLTRAECSQILGISMNTLSRYIQNGYVKTIKLGPRLVRIDPDSVRNLLNNGIPEENDSEAGSGEMETTR